MVTIGDETLRQVGSYWNLPFRAIFGSFIFIILDLSDTLLFQLNRAILLRTKFLLYCLDLQKHHLQTTRA